jgi:iron complex transport system ATP-binding protein
MLEAKDISIGYGRRRVVEGVSLSVEPGSFTAILGPNGAGKSTLMRALNGGIAVNSGQIILDGQPLEAWTRRSMARRLAVVAQEAELRFPVSVIEFVLGGRYAAASTTSLGWETEEDIRTAVAALKETAMTEYASRMLNQLSGGERQRAVLARALATEANILLLDEPTANLDLAHQASMLEVVSRRCKERGSAAVVVTHDLNLAAEFADRVMLIKGGRLVASGLPEEVLTAPLLSRVFDIRVIVDRHPVSGVPRVTPVHGEGRA